MWHASASGRGLGREALRRLALVALNDVGDAKRGEWEEMGNVAFHVHRRLSEVEELVVGPVVDIRGTAEALVRITRVKKRAPYLSLDVMAREAQPPRRNG